MLNRNRNKYHIIHDCCCCSVINPLIIIILRVSYETKFLNNIYFIFTHLTKGNFQIHFIIDKYFILNVLNIEL